METKDRILRIMQERNITQDELAFGAGVSQAAINKILKGTTKKSKYLPDIARFLKVSVDALTENSDLDEEITRAKHKRISELLHNLPDGELDDVEHFVLNLLKNAELKQKHGL